MSGIMTDVIHCGPVSDGPCGRCDVLGQRNGIEVQQS